MELRENSAVVPPGTPVTVRSIPLLNPDEIAVVTMALPFAICGTRTEPGEIVSAKSGVPANPESAENIITAVTATQ